MRPAATIALPVFAVLAAVAVTGMAAGAVGVDAAATNGTLDPATVTIDVQLHDDGNATWTITTKYTLETDEEQRAFERFGSEFVQGDRQQVYPIGMFERIASDVSTETGREMRIENDSRSWDVVESNDSSAFESFETGKERTIGELTLEFTWTNFARTPGDRVILDDVYAIDSGTWFSGLSEEQTLRVHAPDGYLVASAPKGFTNATIRWDGPTQFEEGDLDVTFRRSQVTDDTRGNDSTTTTSTTPGDRLSVTALSAVGVAVVALLLAAYTVTRRRSDVQADSESNSDEGASADAATERQTPREPGGAAPGSVDLDQSEEDERASDAETISGDDIASDDPFAGVDEELLSDEERVERLLEANGGRMKQANIVKETGWSNAKVSQLLSRMDQDGQIDKLRIGRENLISLPGDGIEDSE